MNRTNKNKQVDYIISNMNQLTNDELHQYIEVFTTSVRNIKNRKSLLLLASIFNTYDAETLYSNTLDECNNQHEKEIKDILINTIIKRINKTLSIHDRKLISCALTNSNIFEER